MKKWIFLSFTHNIFTTVDYKLGKECDINIETIMTNKKQGYTFYKSVTLSASNYFISTKYLKNNYMMLKTNEIASVKYIVKCRNKNIFLKVIRFNPSIFFNVPIPSDVIGTVLVDLRFQSNLILLSLNDIKYKCFVINLSENKAIAMTLSHNIHF